MALVASLKIPLGEKIPDFQLSDPSGKTYIAKKLFGKKGLLVIFTCNHCPYALAVWPRLIKIAKIAKVSQVETVAINPNIHPDYPDDSPEQMIQKIKQWKIPFPYLVDETQAVSKSFHAQCTPDIFLFDHRQKLVYHGRVDDNWQNEKKVTQKDLLNAIMALANGQPIERRQIPSMGCSIKWCH
jgi:peroxiredoxin